MRIHVYTIIYTYPHTANASHQTALCMFWQCTNFPSAKSWFSSIRFIKPKEIIQNSILEIAHMEISRITIPYIGITPINHWNNNTGLYDFIWIFHDIPSWWRFSWNGGTPKSSKPSMTSIEIHDDLRILRDLRTHISWRPEAPLETFGTKVLCRGSPGNQKTLQGIGIYSVDFECGINKIIYLGSYLYPGSKSLCYPIKPI